MKIVPSLVLVDLLSPHAYFLGGPPSPLDWVVQPDNWFPILPVLSRMCLNELSLDRIC